MPGTTRSGWVSRRSRRGRRPAARVPPARLAPALGAPARVPRHRAARAPRRSTRPDLVRGDPAERLARFLARVERLTPDELDRLAAAEPPPIAFLATVRRFLSPEAKASFAAAEAELVRRVPPERWAEVGPARGAPGRRRRAGRSRRSWTTCSPSRSAGARASASCAHGTRRWTSRATARTATTWRHCAIAGDRLTRDELAAFLRASQGIAGDDRPWPESLDRDEDEALRISALLAARDVAAAVPVDGLAPASRPGPGGWPRGSGT